MNATVADRHAAVAAVAVDSVARDSFDVYVSFEYVSPVRHPVRWRRYRTAARRTVSDAIALCERSTLRVWAETPQHPIRMFRERRLIMSTVIAKIVEDDGTETVYGPLDVSADDAEALRAVLDPHEQTRQDALAADTVERLRSEQEERSAAAEQANQDRIAAASEGDE